MVDNAALEESDADHFDDNHVDNAEDMGSNGNTDADDAANADIDAPNAYEETENYGREADAMGDYFSADDVPTYLQQRAEAERDRTVWQVRWWEVPPTWPQPLAWSTVVVFVPSPVFVPVFVP